MYQLEKAIRYQRALDIRNKKSTQSSLRKKENLINNLFNKQSGYTLPRLSGILLFLRVRSPARPHGLELESGVWKTVPLIFKTCLVFVRSSQAFTTPFVSTLFFSFSPCLCSLSAHFGYGPVQLSQPQSPCVLFTPTGSSSLSFETSKEGIWLAQPAYGFPWAQTILIN